MWLTMRKRSSYINHPVCTIFATGAFQDGIWASIELVIWCCVGPGIYLVTACLLTCQPLLHHALHASPLLYIRSRLRRIEDCRDLSRSPKQSEEIELHASQKQNHTHFKSLTQDLKTLNPGPRSNANYSEALGQRDEDAFRMPVELDRIHVKHEVMLRSDERLSDVG